MKDKKDKLFCDIINIIVASSEIDPNNGCRYCEVSELICNISKLMFRKEVADES